MTDGKLEKMEKDWSAEVAAALIKTSELQKVRFVLRMTNTLVLGKAAAKSPGTVGSLGEANKNCKKF